MASHVGDEKRSGVEDGSNENERREEERGKRREDRGARGERGFFGVEEVMGGEGVAKGQPRRMQLRRNGIFKSF